MNQHKHNDEKTNLSTKIITHIRTLLVKSDKKECKSIISFFEKNASKLGNPSTDDSNLKKLHSLIAVKMHLLGPKTRDLSKESAWLYWIYSDEKRTKFHFTEPSAEAHRLLRLAQIGSGVMNKLVSRGGTTEIENNSLPLKEFKQKDRDLEKLQDIREKCMDGRFFSHCKERDNLGWALSARLAEENKLGNCEEKSAVIVNFCRKLGPSLNTTVDIFTIGGDHAFVVLGRKPGSDPKDYTTWGNDAVIFDPLSNQCFFARDIPKFLQNFSSTHRKGRLFNQAKPFHPFSQSLFLLQSDSVKHLSAGMQLLQEECDKGLSFKISP